MDVALTTAKVATFNRVDKQAIDAVAITLIIFRRVDATLRGNRVSTSCRIMKRKCINLVTEFGKCRCCRRTGKTGTNNDYFELALIVRIDKFCVGFIVVPLVAQRTFGNFRI